ncbi:hypothetical protein O181_071401 [Austropuccinia psidii MF-1]|uniref:protein-L-isoaspartate(D-aspartate) O-methyltransferase n=1 Tax=Austropuccinia psidii MF-1 TaxID=1389203 RepID=A0A9Q3I6H8_9BASI|nr:hypothetical protein [Austropuccinia psidii MF-1]
MAWRSHGSTNSELIQNLFNNGLMKSARVIEAMNKVDRANYVLPHSKKEAYEDRPQSIGFGATISAPHMHANALEHLVPFLKPSARVLDVGSGSGYMLACLYHLINSIPSRAWVANSPGLILGIEHIPQLAHQSIENLINDGLSKSLETGEIKVVAEDGRNPDPKHGGAWDVIHVGAAAPTIPQALLDQLAAPGRMFIPVGEYDQSIYQIDKNSDGTITQSQLYDVKYVPLTNRESQWEL